jgi:hypothetical protein
MDSSSMATVTDDLSCPVYDGPVGYSFGVEPSLGQYADEMVLSFFVQTVKLITQHRSPLLFKTIEFSHWSPHPNPEAVKKSILKEGERGYWRSFRAIPFYR